MKTVEAIIDPNGEVRLVEPGACVVAATGPGDDS